MNTRIKKIWQASFKKQNTFCATSFVKKYFFTLNNPQKRGGGGGMLIKCFIKSRKKSFSLHRRAKNLTCGNTPKIKKCGRKRTTPERKKNLSKQNGYLFLFKEQSQFHPKLTRKLKLKGSGTRQ